jgi:predicted enzyme related to lactoylglutathione lyase
METGAGKKKTSYDVLTASDRPRAGVIAAQPSSLAGHWLPWVAVDDIDGAVAKVKTLKGKVLVKPHDLPMVGRAATIADPTGAPLGILKTASPEEVKAAQEKAEADKAAAEAKKTGKAGAKAGEDKASGGAPADAEKKPPPK